jgi:PPM family protein phosphatase
VITATDIFCLNELGKRANNEDCISPKKGTATSSDSVFVVCDGVGGENSGEVASEIVCTAVREYLEKEKPVSGTEKVGIQKAIQLANEKLAMYVTTDATAKRMSTTLALVLLGEQSITAAWCGDTRIHHIRNGKVVWKSKDHSLVSELVSQGEITEEEALKHPKRNVITRSLNAFNSNNTVDFHEINDFETGDYLLLCTDGLLEKVNENVIYKILTDESEKDKTKSFLSYCAGVTKDNFSMYLIRGKKIITKPKQFVSRGALIIFFLLLLICIAILMWFVFLHP